MTDHEIHAGCRERGTQRASLVDETGRVGRQHRQVWLLGVQPQQHADAISETSAENALGDVARGQESGSRRAGRNLTRDLQEMEMSERRRVERRGEHGHRAGQVHPTVEPHDTRFGRIVQFLQRAFDTRGRHAVSLSRARPAGTGYSGSGV